MHAINFNYAPKSFNNIWIKNEHRPGNLNLTLRNDNLFMVPPPRIEFFKKMPLYSLPNEWNNSENLMFYENRVTFKIALREKLFQEIVL